MAEVKIILFKNILISEKEKFFIMANSKFVNGDMLERAIKNIGTGTDGRYRKLSDSYTKDEVNALISSAITYKGTLAASEILPALLVAANEGDMYNVTEEFTTTADFVEGAGKTFPAGTEIVIVNTATSGETAVYKFNVFPGYINLDTVTTAEVDAMTGGMWND